MYTISTHSEFRISCQCQIQQDSNRVMTTLLEIPSEFPVRVESREGVGNVLVATRDLRPLEVVLQDPQALPHGPLATQDSPGMGTNTIFIISFKAHCLGIFLCIPQAKDQSLKGPLSKHDLWCLNLRHDPNFSG